jgi:hypothetical protein
VFVYRVMIVIFFIPSRFLRPLTKRPSYGKMPVKMLGLKKLVRNLIFSKMAGYIKNTHYYYKKYTWYKDIDMFGYRVWGKILFVRNLKKWEKYSMFVI